MGNFPTFLFLSSSRKINENIPFLFLNGISTINVTYVRMYVCVSTYMSIFAFSEMENVGRIARVILCALRC